MWDLFLPKELFSVRKPPDLRPGGLKSGGFYIANCRYNVLVTVKKFFRPLSSLCQHRMYIIINIPQYPYCRDNSADNLQSEVFYSQGR